MFRSAAALLLLVLLLTVSGCTPVTQADVARLQQQIQAVLELHASEYRYRDLVYFDEERSVLFLKTVDRAVLFAVDIRVRAGIDLSHGVELSVDRFAAHRISVRLPPATILQADSDETSIREYFIREHGKSIGLLEVSEHIERATSRVAAEAVRRGILGDAEAHARRVVSGLLMMAGFREVVFRPSSARRAPAQ